MWKKSPLAIRNIHHIGTFKPIVLFICLSDFHSAVGTNQVALLVTSWHVKSIRQRSQSVRIQFVWPSRFIPAASVDLCSCFRSPFSDCVMRSSASITARCILPLQLTHAPRLKGLVGQTNNQQGGDSQRKQQNRMTCSHAHMAVTVCEGAGRPPTRFNSRLYLCVWEPNCRFTLAWCWLRCTRVCTFMNARGAHLPIVKLCSRRATSMIYVPPQHPAVFLT